MCVVVCMCCVGRVFTVEVDPRGMPSGAHYAEVRGRCVCCNVCIFHGVNFCGVLYRYVPMMCPDGLRVWSSEYQ